VALDDSAVIAAPIGANFGFDIGDDGVLIWLKDNTGTKTADAVAALNAFSGDTGIGEWLSGPLLPLSYQDPAHDSRTPDIIGITKIGVIYTGGSKIAEHGGFNEDDTHVALLVVNPILNGRSINTAVATTQIAPTILKALGSTRKNSTRCVLKALRRCPAYSESRGKVGSAVPGAPDASR
jgi:hypothetical protein